MAMVAESGLNTHSGERPGVPHALTIDEIKIIQQDFKKAAQRAMAAGADGIEILAGNGWLIDQFLHDNINIRTDEYGGTTENRSRFALEVVEAIAQVVGYQRIGIRLSPFSYFHETDGSQPLEQILHFCHQLVIRGIAYLHVGQGPATRNLDIEQNIRRLTAKGIAREDISLTPFRRLLASVHTTDPQSSPTILIGNGGFNEVSGIVIVEDGLADAVSFGRCFISNPDLVARLRLGYSLTPNDLSTFYTHGAKGYTSYTTYDPEDPVSEATPPLSSPPKSQPKKRVAIVGAGISGIASAAALNREGGFEVKIFERRGVPGGSWVFDPHSPSKIQFPDADFAMLNLTSDKNGTSVPSAFQRPVTPKSLHASPLYPKLRANIPYRVLGGGGIFEIPPPYDSRSSFPTGEEVSSAVEKKARQYDHLIKYHTTVEDCEKTPDGRLRLTLQRESPNGILHWSEEQFDHLIVTTGHTSVPRVPRISGLERWAGGLRHTSTWRSGEDFRGQRILIVGTGDSAIETTLQSLPFVKDTIYISQRTPNPQFPTVFNRQGLEVVATISHLTHDTIHLADGRSLAGIDTIVFATGYLHTYPFLSSEIRPPPVKGYRIPGLYQHIFDMYNPETIAFNGVLDGALSWLTWEKSAFLIALLWSGKIHLPSKDVQEAWESRRLAETGDGKFHALTNIADAVVYFDELNELGAEYLHTEAEDDLLLRNFNFKLVLDWLSSRVQLAGRYGIADEIAVK